jgi:hypothetical protein
VNRAAKILLVTALVGVVGMAFRVSWNALRDVAQAVGADDTAALLYPFVVDGLMALALVATLALTGRDRDFALRVLAAYTVASLLLNYVHGLVPTMQAGERMRLADWAPANWLLVLLATSLPVGAIYFGSDLVAKVLHHDPQPTENADRTDRTTPVQLDPQHVHTALESAGPILAQGTPNGSSVQGNGRTQTSNSPQRTNDAQAARKAVRPTRGKPYDEAELERTRQRAEQAYADSLEAGSPIGPAALGREFGFTEGWGRKRIKAVESRRAEHSDRNLQLVSTSTQG